MKVSKELKYSIIRAFRDLDEKHLINILTETRYPDEIDSLVFRVVKYYLTYNGEIIEPNLILNLKTNVIRVLNIYDSVALDFNINIDVENINSTEMFDSILFQLDKNTTNMKLVELSSLKLVKGE